MDILHRHEKDGQSSKCERIYELYKNTMFYTAYDITQNIDDAEDIVSDSMIKVIDILHKIADDSIGTNRCRNLMITISKNTAIDYLRRCKRQAEIIEYEKNNEREQNTEEMYIEIEDYKAILTYIDELEDMYKDVLRLKNIHNLNSKEIAKILNISVATVNTRYMRAKRKLREKLREKGKDVRCDE